MFSVEQLPAGQGDAVVVEWGQRGNTHKLLIDAGPRPYWDGVRARLKARRDGHYEVFVVTHVDEDHIGGALALLDDFDLRSRIGEIWFNGYVHCAAGGSVLGPVHGEQLTERIALGGYTWNTGFPGSPGPGTGGPVAVGDRAALRWIDLPGGARAMVLAPNGPKLSRLANEWEKVVRKAGLVPGEGAGGEGAFVAPRKKIVTPLPDHLDAAALAHLAARKQSDSSAANGSSIALVVEYAGKRVLLPGDAHPQPLTRNLARFGALVGEPRPRFDLAKLPHHGSGANTTAGFVGALASSRFLISSDGAGYAHPDDSAIARVILGTDGQPTFYCNYASDRTTPWSDRAAEAGARFVLPKPGRSGIVVKV
ncbi:MAG: MBL fold metallo-hydrolase [Actinobacteria bacterium]|nr:MBL fold metallo-hydrolase [Actinomycetota bacterium]